MGAYSRHFVPGYLLPVPTGRHPWGPIPGTSCQATFFLSLRDGIHGRPIPGTSCQATFLLSLRDGIHGDSIPGTSCQATFFLSLRDGNR